MNTTTRIDRTLDRVADHDLQLEELAARLYTLTERFDRLDQAFTDKLNEAYRQGVTDERKARTGHDPKVADDD
jgi:hypothetical protein